MLYQRSAFNTSRTGDVMLAGVSSAMKYHVHELVIEAGAMLLIALILLLGWCAKYCSKCSLEKVMQKEFYPECKDTDIRRNELVRNLAYLILNYT